MGLEKINILEQVASLEVLSEELAKLQRTMRYLLNGNLDFQNIRAKGIQAENIDVDKLSAIVADIGEVTAGIIRGVEIYGSYIATSESDYPRSEMELTGKIKSAKSPTSYVEVTYSGDEGFPSYRIVHGNNKVDIGHGVLLGTEYPGISSNVPFVMFNIGGTYIVGDAQFSSWLNVINNNTGRSLQQEFDEIRDQLDALTTAVNNKAEKGANTSSAGSHNHGIEDGTVLMTSTGTVTWRSAGGHSHTQN